MQRIFYRRLFIAFALLSISSTSFSQKKQLDHSVYDDWKSLRDISISHDGRFVNAIISPQEGDSTLDAVATPLLPVADWSVGYFRQGAWGPALNAEAQGAAQPVPDGVRVVLQLPPGHGLSGAVTRDWVRPTLAIARGG